MPAKRTTVAANALLFVVLSAAAAPAHPGQTTLLDEARNAFNSAQQLEAELNAKASKDRSRAEYVKVINAFQRVYVITPHTGYADNALLAMARLYEEIKDPRAALRTWNFLLREYPKTPFAADGEKAIARLAGQSEATTRQPSQVSKVSQISQVGSETASSRTETAVVDGIRYWEAPNSVRVVIDVTGAMSFKQGEAKSPDRVFLDISPARLNSGLLNKQWPAKSGLLEQIRAGQYDNSTVRVVLDVGHIGSVTAFTLRDPDRIVIDVVGEQISAIRPLQSHSDTRRITATASVTAAPAPVTSTPVPASPAPVTPVKAPVTATSTTAGSSGAQPVLPPAPDPRPTATTRIAAPAKPTSDGARSLVRSLGLKLSRVVIDAGHGGHDTGTIGPSGYMEKEVVLDVAVRLKELIETNLGAEVVMTRNRDVFVPLEARTAIANQQQADLFISIHANSSKSKTVRGVETFFLNITTSREVLDTASRENATSSGQIHELDDIVKKIMMRDKIDESRDLAQHIQRSLAALKGSGPDRGVKEAPFVVLIGAGMPSVLAEIGFISNPSDEKLIKTPAWRQQIAESLFAGVRSYSDTLSGLKTAKTQEKTQE